MSILLFLLILGVLIFVHELGHFLVAKATGMRVDEFAIGFPPRLFSKKIGKTQYSINLLPLGGYVKIFGENPDEEGASEDAARGSFAKSPLLSQALVLVAGVTFNIIFAWMLITISFMSGFLAPQAFKGAGELDNSQIIIGAMTSDDAPAAQAGLEIKDAIISLTSGENVLTGEFEVNDIITFVADNSENTIDVIVNRSGEEVMISVTPEVMPGSDRKVIGIAMERVGIVDLPFLTAMYQGAITTGLLIKETVVGLGILVSGGAELNQVSGPVGIVGMVGDAAQFGFAYLLTFTALISINLAVINILPIPALDGGRLVFVIIEAVTRRKIPAKIYGTVNTVGFVALLTLMAIITVSDVWKLF